MKNQTDLVQAGKIYQQSQLTINPQNNHIDNIKVSKSTIWTELQAQTAANKLTLQI